MVNNSIVINEIQNDSGHIEFFCHTYDFSTITSALFILIFIISVIGNIVLLCVLVKYENLKNMTNILVLNLAFSDLVFTFTLPFWAVYHLHHWVFGDFLCKFVTAAYFVGLYSSIILLTSLTVDRYVTVVMHKWPSTHPMRRRCVIGACVAAWTISIGASLSDAIPINVDHWNDFYTCETPDGPEAHLAFYLQVSLLFFLPFVIIIFCYSAILKTVLQTSNRKRHRTVVVVLCIVGVFFLCWGPYNIVLLIYSLHEPSSCNERKQLNVAFHISRILAYSHCCMNPFFYMLSQRLRGHLLNLFHYMHVKKINTTQSTTVIGNVAFTANNSAVMLPNSRRPSESVLM